MNQTRSLGLSKVPAVTLTFWVIKVLATTLGETGGDFVSMTLNLGYAVASLIFIAVFLVAVVAQITTNTFRPFLYWAVIVATTTAGTTMADFADRSLGIGYVGGSAILFVLLLASFGVWRVSTGPVAIDAVQSGKVEMFYWITILLSQTLGTALGDWMADTNGLGYGGGALVFVAALALVLIAYFLTNASRTMLFWSAFILTRPLGATLGDFFDKPLADGGLAMSRLIASVVLLVVITVLIATMPQRAGGHPGQRSAAT